MYHLKQGSMSVSEFKAKYKERVACFPLWREVDKLELVDILNDFLKYLISAYEKGWRSMLLECG